MIATIFDNDCVLLSADFNHTIVEDKIPNTREQACLFLCVGTKLGFVSNYFFSFNIRNIFIIIIILDA